MKKLIMLLLCMFSLDLCAVQTEEQKKFFTVVKSGDIETIKNWDFSNFDIDQLNEDGNGAIHFAAKSNNLAMVQLLVEKGADCKLLNERKSSALHFTSSLEVLEYFTGQGLDIYHKNQFGCTILHVACSLRSSLEYIKHLIEEQECSIDKVDNEAWTILHDAAKGGNLATIKYLVGLGLNCNAVTKHGSTPLSIAALNGRYEAVRYFIEEQKCSIDKVDNEGWTILHDVAYSGDLATIKYLVGLGLNCNAATEMGTTPLMIAVSNRNLDAVKYLIKEQKCLLDVVDKNGWGLLHSAAQKGDLETIKYLVGLGLDCNAATEMGTTPLMIVVLNRNLDAVKYLIKEQKCLLDVVDKNGWGLLHSAAQEGDLETIKYLVGLGLDCNAATEMGTTPLMIAVLNRNLDTVKYLIKEQKCLLDVVDKNGWGLLHYAAQGGDVETIKYLVDLGLDCNVATESGATPLTIAAVNGNLYAVKYLMGAGVNIFISSQLSSFLEREVAKRNDSNLTKNYLLSREYIDSFNDKNRLFFDPVRYIQHYSDLFSGNRTGLSDLGIALLAAYRNNNYHQYVHNILINLGKQRFLEKTNNLLSRFELDRNIKEHLEANNIPYSKDDITMQYGIQAIACMSKSVCNFKFR